MNKIIEKIEEGRHFGHVTHVTPLSGGIIQQTYQVTTTTGDFILQKLARAETAQSLMDHHRIVDRLLKNFLRVPSVLGYWELDGDYWKLSEYIEHSPDFEMSNDAASNAAMHLAETHNALSCCDFTPVRQIPGFHDHKTIFARLLRKTETMDRKRDIATIGRHIVDLARGVSLADRQSQIIHGDPKSNNFLFKNEGDVAALIDWDTLMVGNPLIDIGDMMRSFCKGKKGEFDTERFGLMAARYSEFVRKGCPIGAILDATKLITLELAARYLIDWFDDCYFGWDQTKFGSRRESNLASAKKYVAYFETMP